MQWQQQFSLHIMRAHIWVNLLKSLVWIIRKRENWGVIECEKSMKCAPLLFLHKIDLSLPLTKKPFFPSLLDCLFICIKLLLIYYWFLRKVHISMHIVFTFKSVYSDLLRYNRSLKYEYYFYEGLFKKELSENFIVLS